MPHIAFAIKLETLFTYFIGEGGPKARDGFFALLMRAYGRKFKTTEFHLGPRRGY